jgi:hypothetical protein
MTDASYFFERTPEREENIQARHIEFRWLAAESGEEKTFVVLSISHSTTQRRYSAYLRSQTEAPASYGGRMVRFGVFGGVGITQSDVVARYSQKALAKFADEALPILRQNTEHERVQAIVDAACEGSVVAA